MTLHTRVAITGPIPTRTAFDLALQAVCTAAGEAARIATAQIEGPEDCYEPGVRRIGSVIGQGLPALTWCTFRPDGPLHPEDAYDDEYAEEGEEPYFMSPACSLMLHWDTAYGFTGPNGMGCSDLHSIAIAHVCQELTKRGLGMHWHNEYTGEWHLGIENLDTLSAAGLEADLWYRNTALPAIALHIASEGECR